MSTSDGHSDLQDLHSRHKSRTSIKSSDVKLLVESPPLIAALNAFALPLVVCFSSRVAM